MPPETRSFEIKRWRGGAAPRTVDNVAVEEPLAISLHHWRKQLAVTENLAVTMRTPGADRELAVGLLLTEGIIQASSDIVAVRSLGIDPSNEILIELAPHVDFEAWRQQRSGIVSSSCGICGKAGIDQICQDAPPLATSDWRVTPGLIQSLPALLLPNQAVFNQTGGVHAAALFSLQGQLESMFEDIGRHNALDKVAGDGALKNKLPLTNQIVFLSSRASFELIQKAAMAGVQLLACVGAPSSLAIETARAVGMTLLCFVRGERFNVYSGEWRLNL